MHKNPVEDALVFQKYIESLSKYRKEFVDSFNALQAHEDDLFASGLAAYIQLGGESVSAPTQPVEVRKLPRPYYRCTSARSTRYRTDSSDEQCARAATHSVNGLLLCQQHAGSLVLELTVKE